MSIVEKVKEIFSIPPDDLDSDLDFVTEKVEARTADEKAELSKKSKVVNINATTQLQVVLANPEKFEDCPTIADHLNAKRTVVLNLETTPKETNRRLIDFLTGVAYANDGQIQRVANSTFIITPYNVDLMGDILGELESSGYYV